MAESSVDELFKGLQALSQAAFPKRCANCGREFESVDAYLQETQHVRGHSGLKHGLGDEGESVVQLFRNCVCGSTLMDFFSDRRDTSERGLKRRETFGKILQLLEQKGLDAATARRELLSVMRGQPSKILERFGVRTDSV